MPYLNFKGKRESATLNSEEYKKLIDIFMQVNDYVLQANSAIHGCFADFIYKNPTKDGDIETWVEAKWTEFSLNEKDTRKEFTQYLLLYLRTPPDRRFKLLIFAKKVKNEAYHRKLFETLDKNIISQFLDTIKSEVTMADSQFLDQVSIEEVIDFFCDTTLINTDLDNLKLKISQKTNPMFDSNDPFLRYSHLKEKNGITSEKDMIATNLLEIKNFKTVWIAKTQYRSVRKVFEVIEGWCPPFVLHKGKIISLYPFDDEKSNPLTKIIDVPTVEMINVKNWARDKNGRRLLIYLLNISAMKLCKLRGLLRKKGEWVYYFPRRKIDPQDQSTTEWYSSTRNRKNTRIIFKRFKPTKGVGSYYYHPAVKIIATYADEKFYYQILPKMVFTKDGQKPLSSQKAMIAERKFRKSHYSYNLNLLNSQRFWFQVIFLKQPQTKLLDYHHGFQNQKHANRLLRILGVHGYYKTELSVKPIITPNEGRSNHEKTKNLRKRMNVKGSDPQKYLVGGKISRETQVFPRKNVEIWKKRDGL